MEKLDYRNARKGWSNRKFRQTIIQRLVDGGLWNIPTRTEQEAFIGSFISQYDNLKVGAAKSIMRSLHNVFDSETGECIMKRFTKEEFSKIRSEAKLKSTAERVMSRVAEIQAKMTRGERLSGAERKFKSLHKEMFSVTLEAETCNRKQVLQVSANRVTLPAYPPKAAKEPRKAAKEASKGSKKPKKGNLKPILSLKDSYGQNTETGNRRQV